MSATEGFCGCDAVSRLKTLRVFPPAGGEGGRVSARELTAAEEVLLGRFERLQQQLRSLSELQRSDLRGRGEQLEQLADIHVGELKIALDELADITAEVRQALVDLELPTG